MGRRLVVCVKGWGMVLFFSAWRDPGPLWDGRVWNVSVMTQGCLTQASRPVVCLFVQGTQAQELHTLARFMRSFPFNYREVAFVNLHRFYTPGKGDSDAKSQKVGNCGTTGTSVWGTRRVGEVSFWDGVETYYCLL